jgi:peptidyl-tRNA hydrolase, PTH1 family
MKYIIGLGNPTKKYKNTRHNIGQDVVFRLIDDMGEMIGVKFINPECYMNESGVALKKLLKNVKAGSENKNILVIHDDLDQTIGKVKMSYGGNSGGHNGINSIYSIMGIKDYYRLKIGICPEVKPAKDEISNFVVGKFNPDEKDMMKKLYPKLLEGVKLFVEGGVDRAVEAVNRK